MADSKLTALTETSVPALDDLGYSVDVSDTTDDAAGSSRKLSFNRIGGLFTPSYCDGRLTLETGVPISTSDQSAKSTLYFTPYLGGRISIYDGTRWKLYSFTERSLSLSSLTSGKNYDVFIYDNSGTLTLELSAAWTNDTTRADALTTQDGVYVKSGTTTRRWLGTIRTTGTTTTEDSKTKRFVWNNYNRIARPLRYASSANSWSYASTTVRQANGNSAYQVEAVNGDVTYVEIGVHCPCESTNTNYAWIGIGIDSTTTAETDTIGGGGGTNANVREFNAAFLRRNIATGYHKYCWLEAISTSGAGMNYFADYFAIGEHSGLFGSILA